MAIQRWVLPTWMSMQMRWPLDHSYVKWENACSASVVSVMSQPWGDGACLELMSAKGPTGVHSQQELAIHQRTTGPYGCMFAIPQC
jgi:hypothetical protein